MQGHYYDDYDYPSYWEGRSYEHQSEAHAVSEFLSKVKSIKTVADIGCGFGRLIPLYAHRARRVYLIEPSVTLLEKACLKAGFFCGDRRKIGSICGTVESLKTSIRPSSIDLVLFIRVMHHLDDPREAIENIHKVLTPKGHLIIEFANKLHGKAIFKNFMKGNFTYPMEISPIDRRSTKNQKKKSISFKNFHPDSVKELLFEAGFEIVEVRSVSNIRSTFIKKHFPEEVLNWVEKFLQKLLVFVWFGPSIFILAKKKA